MGKTIPTEELRLALVMNGGVSLAVWIGGVTREIARMLSRKSAYGELLDWLSIEPRVDVIAGTSAGGVNGAYLAMAMAHHQAGPMLDTRIAGLRQLWVDRASFEDLLRSPYDPAPPSFLDGDGFYFRVLRDAFAELEGTGMTDPSAVPVDLVLTTTLVRGVARNYADDFGNRVGDVNHRAFFKFRRGPDLGDAFKDPDIARRLAVATRATSSFPGAFEPRFVRVAGDEDPAHPDMAGAASFKESHFAIDGGVLDNKPIDQALTCIFSQRADRPTRRVLAYVVPDPQITLGASRGDSLDEPPPLLDVAIDSLVKIPAVQSIGNQLDALREHNRKVRERKRIRTIITRKTPPTEIDRLAEALFDAYRDLSVANGVDGVIAGINRCLVAQDDGIALGRRGRREWIEARVRKDKNYLPWIPLTNPVDPAAAAERGDDWRWGTKPPKHLARVLLDIVGRAQRLAVAVEPEADLSASWKDAFDLIRDADALHAGDADYWRADAARIEEMLGKSGAMGDAAAAEEWFQAKLRGWRKEARDPARGIALRIAETLHEFEPIARPIADKAVDNKAESVAVAGWELRQLLRFFIREREESDDTILKRLLIFEVIQEVLDGAAVDAEEEVNFLQITGDGQAAFGGPSAAAEKLSGVQLAHFGAFYKTSWRANDWLWGRMDAVRRLIPLLLDPARLRLVARKAGGKKASAIAADKIEEIALAALDPPDQNSRRILEERFSRDAVLAELDFLDDPALPLPEHLPVAAEALRRRLELDILRTELPLVKVAIEEDEAQRMYVGRSARAFLARCAAVVPPGGSYAPAERIAELLDLLRVGEEKFMNELGTDRATLAAAQTAAVAVAAVQAEKGWFKAVGGMFRLLRMPTLLFYNFARNTLIDSKTGVAINASLFAASLAVLLSALLRVADYPAWVLALAGTIFVIALLLLVIRLPRWLKWSVWLLFAAGGAVALIFWRSWLQPVIAWFDRIGLATWQAVTAAESAILLLLLASFFLPAPIRRSRRFQGLKPRNWLRRLRRA